MVFLMFQIIGSSWSLPAALALIQDVESMAEPITKWKQSDWLLLYALLLQAGGPMLTFLYLDIISTA